MNIGNKFQFDYHVSNLSLLMMHPVGGWVWVQGPDSCVTLDCGWPSSICHYQCTMKKYTSGGWPRKWAFQHLIYYLEKFCQYLVNLKRLSFCKKNHLKYLSLPHFYAQYLVAWLMAARFPIVQCSLFSKHHFYLSNPSHYFIWARHHTCRIPHTCLYTW